MNGDLVLLIRPIGLEYHPIEGTLFIRADNKLLEPAEQRGRGYRKVQTDTVLWEQLKTLLSSVKPKGISGLEFTRPLENNGPLRVSGTDPVWFTTFVRFGPEMKWEYYPLYGLYGCASEREVLKQRGWGSPSDEQLLLWQGEVTEALKA